MYSELVQSRIGMKVGTKTIIAYDRIKEMYLFECSCGAKTSSILSRGKAGCRLCLTQALLEEQRERFLGKTVGSREVTKVYQQDRRIVLDLSCTKGHVSTYWVCNLHQAANLCHPCSLEKRRETLVGKTLGVSTVLEILPRLGTVLQFRVRCICGRNLVVSEGNFNRVKMNCTCDGNYNRREVKIGERVFTSTLEASLHYKVPVAVLWRGRRKGGDIEEKIRNYTPRLKEIKPKYRVPEVKKTISNIFNIFRKGKKGEFYSQQKVGNEIRYLDTIKDVVGGQHELKYFGMPCDGGEIKLLQEHCGLDEAGSMAIEYKMNTYQALLYAFKKLGLGIPVHKGDVNKYIKDSLEMEYQYMHLDYVSPLTHSAFEAVGKALNYTPAILVTVQANKGVNGLMNGRISQNPATYKIFGDGVFPAIEGVKQLWANEYIGKSTPMVTYCLTKL